MRVIEVRDRRGIESLAVVERPDPFPGPGQISIEFRAFSLNYRDLLVVRGVGRWRPSLPRIPVSDGIGVVAAMGSGVSRVQMGDRVAPIFYPNWLKGGVSEEKLTSPLGGATADGVLAEKAVFDESWVVRVPEHLSDEEAATLPCAGVTAWNAVAADGRIAPGDTVVVLGTGGVSIFALQFARLLGAFVIVTSSSDEKLARAKQLGADAGINYRTTPAWPNAVMELSGGLGADRVIDTVGGLRGDRGHPGRRFSSVRRSLGGHERGGRLGRVDGQERASAGHRRRLARDVRSDESGDSMPPNAAHGRSSIQFL
jgi:NADPH:quinone reductase-like Zn-dependent oxidoreductase